MKMATRVEVMHEVSSIVFHSSRLIWLQPLVSGQPANDIDQYYSAEGSLSVRVGCLYSILSILDKAVDYSHWNGHLFCSKCFAQTMITENVLFIIMVFHLEFFMVKKFILPNMKCNDGLLLIKFTCFLMSPITRKLREKLNVLSGGSITVPAE